MRIITFTGLLALGATPLAAEDWPAGCFGRSYDAAHLAANPGQGVAELTVLFGPHAVAEFSADLSYARIAAVMAGQGQGTGLDGRTLRELAICGMDGRSDCAVECDGGAFEIVSADADGLTIETAYLRVAEAGCSGDVDMASLAEEGEALTRYRLERLPDAACEGMEWVLE